jgi:transglutaminase-like putative cysteine protease
MPNHQQMLLKKVEIRAKAPHGRLILYQGTDVCERSSSASAGQRRIYLLGSRYCETDRLSDVAWSLFGQFPKGWPLVQAICDYVHDRIAFGYQHASPIKTAWDAYAERRGVCRDFAHLAVTFCRCMNVPARYCAGYLGDIGVPPDPAPMDFSAWFEAYLGGRWYTFDARHNKPRIGRILMARGRDATDVAIVTSFGPCVLAGFRVFTEEITSADPAPK